MFGFAQNTQNNSISSVLALSAPRIPSTFARIALALKSRRSWGLRGCSSTHSKLKVRVSPGYEFWPSHDGAFYGPLEHCS